MPRKPVLLGVFAHPDDESFGPGATLARYAAQGAAVHIIIATDGIAGSVGDPSDLANHDTLAQVRSTELSNAIVALGATSVWSLPYRDSGMRGSPDNDNPAALIRQPVEQVVQETLGYFRRLRPDVVVTHDPYGGYGHPDHIRVCEAVTAAFHVTRGEVAHQQDAGWRGPQKLYYTAFPKDMVRFFLRVGKLMGRDMTRFGRNQDINLVGSPQFAPEFDQKRWRSLSGGEQPRSSQSGLWRLMVKSVSQHGGQDGGRIGHQLQRRPRLR